MSEQHTPDDQSSTITRRKFTLTERLDADLQRFADLHYQGNVSLCLRAAYEDHKNTLNGEGRIALKRLEQEVGQLREITTELNREVSDIAEDIKDLKDRGSHRELPSVIDGANSDAQQVIDELHSARTPLRIEDLLERAGLSPRRIVTALEQLVNLGLVVETPEGARYQLSMMQSTTHTDRNHE
jgi:DNA-binding transcriptional regulator GbsR (MarR family)